MTKRQTEMNAMMRTTTPVNFMASCLVGACTFLSSSTLSEKYPLAREKKDSDVALATFSFICNPTHSQ